MTTATLTMKTPAAAPNVGEATAKTSANAKPAQKSWFARAFDALVEARMRQAHREIERYLLTAPEDLRKEHAGKFGNYDDVGVRFMI